MRGGEGPQRLKPESSLQLYAALEGPLFHGRARVCRSFPQPLKPCPSGSWFWRYSPLRGLEILSTLWFGMPPLRGGFRVRVTSVTSGGKAILSQYLVQY